MDSWEDIWGKLESKYDTFDTYEVKLKMPSAKLRPFYLSHIVLCKFAVFFFFSALSTLDICGSGCMRATLGSSATLHGSIDHDTDMLPINHI